MQLRCNPPLSKTRLAVNIGEGDDASHSRIPSDSSDNDTLLRIYIATTTLSLEPKLSGVSLPSPLSPRPAPALALVRSR